MVSQGSPTNPNNSRNLHHFLISIDSNISSQNQHFHSFGAATSYPHSLGGHVLSDELNHNNTHFNPHPHPQTLSLSLDSGNILQLPPVEYSRQTSFMPISNPTCLFSGEETRYVCNYSSFNATAYASSSTSFDQSTTSTLYGIDSKYLKAVQSLLEEIVSTSSNDIELSNNKYVRKLSRHDKRGSLQVSFELKTELCRNELSLEKNEIQATISNLISLLEEVERRFEEYHNHMEGVVSSFEAIAGLGRGKCYTALALEAMSRHFCSLRDAIVSQIYANKRKLISQDTVLPRMRLLLDEESRHNNNRISLQHLGMLRQTWRPIRGLPETSVAILRSWLFEHFLHPYPNDNEKLLLASQTGLTKNQVSNWFINARVRLWKPMIEEMYKEEFEDSDE